MEKENVLPLGNEDEKATLLESVLAAAAAGNGDDEDDSFERPSPIKVESAAEHKFMMQVRSWKNILLTKA